MILNPLFQRLELLTGPDTMAALGNSQVMVFGLGGVGSWCAEALVRSGIGGISLVDFDTVCISNTNRQIQALSGTIGRLKAEVLGERLKDINPECKIKTFPHVFSKSTADRFDFNEADYIIDAIDMLDSKLDLIEAAFSYEKTIFSSMGMAFKLDPTQIRVADIWKSSACPLARLVRQGLRKRGFNGHFQVVYSPERLPLVGVGETVDESFGQASEACAAGEASGSIKKPIGSAVPVTAAAGMTLASLVIRDIYRRSHE